MYFQVVQCKWWPALFSLARAERMVPAILYVVEIKNMKYTYLTFYLLCKFGSMKLGWNEGVKNLNNSRKHLHMWKPDIMVFQEVGIMR